LSEFDEVLKTFLIESNERLEEMETKLLELEAHPDDEETINAVFRAAHTIKGAAGIVGLDAIERFTHGVENVLDRVRNGDVAITEDLVGLLLECRDHVLRMIRQVEVGESPETENMKASGAALTERLAGYLPGAATPAAKKVEESCTSLLPATGWPVMSDNYHISLRFSQDTLRNGMDPLPFVGYLSRLGEIVNITAITEGIPPAGEMDPETCYIGFEIDFASTSDKQTIEDVFEFLSEDSRIRILPPRTSIQDYIEMITGLPEDPMRLGEMLINGGALTRAELNLALEQQEILRERENKEELIGQVIIAEKMAHEEVVEVALEKQKKDRETTAGGTAKTIRIDTVKLDHLVNLVGELVTAGANIEQHVQRIGDAGLAESASDLYRLIEDIRDTAMKARMVPIGETFNKFQRVVRDISRDFDKNINLVITGGDTELDKTVVEKINDPLMHLIRNAADHGIETPEQREMLEKQPQGTITLNAYQDAGCIVIEVIDDGKGLDKDRILQKALSLGVVNPGQNLSERDIYRLIFAAGFSTAERITNVSGRGVGMDVVKTNIEALRGTVEVESRAGGGTTMRIRLPLTLAIIDGFLVGIGTASYVIPLDMVIECIELPKSEKNGNRRNYINLRGEVLPYVRLREVFREQAGVSEYENLVVVQFAGQKIGLVVDVLHGGMQAVIKSLGTMYRDIEGISGATILGDGTVALIVDVPHLVRVVEQEQEQARARC